MNTTLANAAPFNDSGLDLPAWFSGSLTSYQELYKLRERIHQREARVGRCLRHLFVTGLAIVLLASLVGQYALAASDVGLDSTGMLLIVLLPLFCGLIIAGVHIIEMRFSEMADDGFYAISLQKNLHRMDVQAVPQEVDPVARLILEDARQLNIALAEHRPIHPALIGEGLRLGH